MGIGPYNIEARVDVWNGEIVKGRIRKRQRSEVVCVCDLGLNQ